MARAVAHVLCWSPVQQIRKPLDESTQAMGVLYPVGPERPRKEPMYDACLFCETPFRKNKALTELPLGRSVAYDPNRGRLWQVCRRCRRWCLIPLESRWEPLQELETLFKAARTSASAMDMARFRHRGVSVLRLGAPSRRDEAWCQYGRGLQIRRLVRRPLSIGFMLVGTAGFVILAGVSDTVAMIGSSGLVGVLFLFAELPRLATYGLFAWRGDLRCRKCGARRSKLRFSEFDRVELRMGRLGALAVRMPCRKCDRWTLKLHGPEAQGLLLRGLSHRHFFGASRQLLNSAVALIEDAPSASSFLRTMALREDRIRTFSPEERMAVEIAVVERGESESGTRMLEDYRPTWNEEETMASIMDEELTPLPEPMAWDEGEI